MFVCPGGFGTNSETLLQGERHGGTKIPPQYSWEVMTAREKGGVSSNKEPVHKKTTRNQLSPVEPTSESVHNLPIMTSNYKLIEG